MRLYLALTKNSTVIPFNYQHLLTGCIHKWLGKANKQHGEISMYSFSWLQTVQSSKKGLWTTENTHLFVNFYDTELAKKVVFSIMENPEMFCGVKVREVTIQAPPEFTDKAYFYVASPVLIQRDNGKGGKKHYRYYEEKASQLLTETLQKKLMKADLSPKNVRVYFDVDYLKAKTKLITYNKMDKKVNVCPIIIEGSPEQLKFAWHVGVGNSTGIGFGALRSRL